MKRVTIITLAAALAAAAFADSFKAPELSGTVFGQIRYDLSAKDEGFQKGAWDFDLTRCYVNVKGALVEKLYYRVTADIFREEKTTYALTTDPTTFGYTLTSSTSKGLFQLGLKYAFIDVRDVIPGHSIYAGMEQTPYPSFEEGIWGWRIVRKTAVDDRGYLDTADLGVGVGGKFGDGIVTHHLTVTNGAGYKSPEPSVSATRNSGKDVDYRVSFFPLKANENLKGLSVTAMAKAGNLGEKVAAGEEKQPITVYGGLLGFQYPVVDFGAGYFTKTVGNASATGDDVNGNLMTGFATGHFKATEGITIHPFVRYDTYEPNQDADDDERTLIIGGVGFKFFGDTLALIPNYQTESYKALNTATPPAMEKKSTDYVYLHCQWDWK